MINLAPIQEICHMPGNLLYFPGEQPVVWFFFFSGRKLIGWGLGYKTRVRGKWLHKGRWACQDFKWSVQSTYLQLLIGRRVQIILLKLGKAEVLIFYSWGRFITPCFQWTTELRFKFIYPLPLSRPQCLQAVSALSTHL